MGGGPKYENKTNSVKHIAMSSSFMTPQAIAGSESNNFMLKFIATGKSAKLLCVVSNNFEL